MYNLNEWPQSVAKEGFCILKNFIDVDEIPIVQNEVEKIISLGCESGCVRPNNTLLPLRWNDFLVELF